MSHPTPIEGLEIRRARPDDEAQVVALLSAEKLSLPGLAEHFGDFLVAERDGAIVGALGLELRGADALLRSAVVAPSERGRHLGDDLFHSLKDYARERGVTTFYLLTTSAERYWAMRGFAVVSRDVVPEAVKDSEEFRGACPASATAMSRRI